MYKLCISFLLSLFVINFSWAQAEKFITIELAAAKLVNEKRWDDLILLAPELISEDPSRGEGYYFTSFAFAKLQNFDKAKEYLNIALNKKNNSPSLKKIQDLKSEIEISEIQFKNKEKIDLLGEKATGDDYRKLWELDKSKVEYAISAIEIYIKQEKYFTVIEILEDSIFLKDESAGTLLDKINHMPQVVKVRKYNQEVKSGQYYLNNQNYTEAIKNFENALRYFPNDRTSQSFLKKAKEEYAWNNVLNTNIPSQEAIAAEFYSNYPQSNYKSDAIKLWQKSFLNNAASLNDEASLVKLKSFRQTFNFTSIDASLIQKANDLYQKKWRDAYERYNQEYIETKKFISKRVAKEWFKTILGSAIVYGFGYGIQSIAGAEYDGQNLGLIGAGTYFVFSFTLSPPWSAAKSSRKQNKYTWEKVQQYSKSPTFY